MTLLRHPLLAAPPIPSPTESHTTLAAPLLAFYALIHTLPHLATSTQTSTAIALPWSFPTSVEVIMKTHTHRGTRLLAWRILRKWYGFYAGLGEALREAWVWKGEGSEQGSFAPLPPYVAEYKDEYESLFGEWKGESADADLVAGWTAECTGDARFVDGGIEVLVRERAIDAWILPAVVDAKAREERANLWRVDTVPASSFSADDDAAFAAATSLGSITAGELSSTVVNVEGYLLFREGFIPSTSYPSLSPTARTPAAANALPSTTGPKPEPFVPTPATTKLLHSLALHTLRRLPVLISSPPSSGKASTITHLWSLLHAHPRSSAATPSARQRSLVLINLADRSLDSKSLLGSLSSAPATADTEAGTFAFVEGPLTRAVRQGRWVVLSGIDQASIEVLSVIKVLVERMRRASESAVGAAWGGGGNEESGGVGVRVGGGEGRWVSAGRGFMLFATRSVDGGVSGAGPEANFFTSGFWSEVWMDGPKRDEIGLIVQGRYPRLRAAGLAERLIGVWDGVRDVVVKDGGAGTNRSIGVRDLMRRASSTLNPVFTNADFSEQVVSPSRRPHPARRRHHVDRIEPYPARGGLHRGARRLPWIAPRPTHRRHVARRTGARPVCTRRARAGAGSRTQPGARRVGHPPPRARARRAPPRGGRRYRLDRRARAQDRSRLAAVPAYRAPRGVVAPVRAHEAESRRAREARRLGSPFRTSSHGRRDWNRQDGRRRPPRRSARQEPHRAQPQQQIGRASCRERV